MSDDIRITINSILMVAGAIAIVGLFGLAVGVVNLRFTEKKIDMLQEKGLLTNETIEALIEEVQL